MQPNNLWSALRCAPVILILGLSSGCIYYPWPHTTVRMAAKSGQVLDERTHNPIPGVKVFIHGHPQISTTTKSDGTFKLKQINNWHWGYTAVACAQDVPSGDYWADGIVLEHTNYFRRSIDCGDAQPPTKIFLRSHAEGPPSLIFNSRGEILEDHGAAKYLQPDGIRFIPLTNSPYVKIEVKFSQIPQKRTLVPVDDPTYWETESHYLPAGRFEFVIKFARYPKEKTDPLSRKYRLELAP